MEVVKQTDSIEASPVLTVDQLNVNFGQAKVVDKISFSIKRGETFALVRESGSVKSITALSVLRLMPNNARVKAVAIRLVDEDLLAKTELEFCKVRSRRIAMIF